MLGPRHIVTIILSAVIIAALSFILRNTPREKIKKLLKILCIIVLTLDPIYWIWEYINFGAMDISTTLPLYMCSLFEILLPIVAFSKKEGWLWRSAVSSICTLIMIFGFCGFVFNTHLNNYPFYTFIPLRSLLFHFLMVLVPCIMWSSGYYKRERRDIWLGFIPVLALVAVAAVVDKTYGFDYCYLNGGRGTPFEIISRAFPIYFPVVIYLGLFILNALIFYAKIVFNSIKNFFLRRHSKHERIRTGL